MADKWLQRAGFRKGKDFNRDVQEAGRWRMNDLHGRPIVVKKVPKSRIVPQQVTQVIEEGISIYY